MKKIITPVAIMLLAFTSLNSCQKLEDLAQMTGHESDYGGIPDARVLHRDHEFDEKKCCEKRKR